MSTPRRDLALTLFLLAVLIAATVAIYVRQGPPPTTAPPLSTHGSGSDGGLALYRWLGRLGYDSRRLEAETFAVPDTARLLLAVRSAEASAYSGDEIAAVQRWVVNGGDLVLIDVDLTGDALLAAFGAGAGAPAGGPAQTATPSQPFWGASPPRILQAEAALGLRLDPAFVVLATAQDGTPLVAVRQMGAGRVFAISAPFLLENAGIGVAGNRSLVGVLLAGVPRGAMVAFDEYHQGFAAQPAAQGLADVLVATAPGRAVLFAALIALAYLVLSGRRLGPPLPELEAPARSMAEYLISMAAILRRAGLRDSVAEAYRRDFRQAVADRYSVRATDDATLIAALTARLPAGDPRPARAQEALRQRSGGSERALLEYVRGLDSLRAELDA